MQLATILPTKYLDLIKGDKYHMALAHLVLKDEIYTEFYRQQSKKDAYVILDNGVIEGEQQQLGDIIMRARVIGAQEIILPDVFQDADATIASSYKALKTCREKYGREFKLMAVPQGKTIEEWLECAEVMLDWDIDCLGIPKVLTKMGGRDARLKVLAELKDTILRRQLTFAFRLDIHLLGCWENPLELTMITKAEQSKVIPPIRGCDSAIAYVYSEKGILLSEDERPAGPVDFKEKDTDLTILEKNIKLWKRSVITSRGKVVDIL
jgi:hypothetical protein